jgi:hypothetical protein
MSPTKSSTPKLSDRARHVVAPEGVVSTGFPAVEAKCADLGIRFRWWQRPIGQLILAKRADGKYAATVGGTGLSIPRQVGKTFLVGAVVFALCLLFPRLTVVWTAHRVRTAEETFKKMQGFARRKRIAPHVLKVVLGSGEESIEFRNGSRILFGARATGFGRGFDEVDVLIFDEAQILTEIALDDMVPATNQSRQTTSALLLFLGTPPRPTDPGEVFTRMRTEALSGEDPDTGWVEFGADPDFEPTPLPAPLTAADWEQVAKANPSFPEDTPREAILRMRKKLGHESFKREGYGIWDEVDELHRVIPSAVWKSLEADDPPGQDVAPSALGLDMSHDRVIVISGCWFDPATDVAHVELLAVDQVMDTAGAVDWLAARAGRRIAVVVDEYSPAAEMVPGLRARRVKVTVSRSPDMAKACSGFYGDVIAVPARLTHADQVQLNDAVAGGRKRKIGEAGGWGWDRRDPDVNIAPLVSVTLARFGAVVNRPKVRNSGKLVVLS